MDEQRTSFGSKLAGLGRAALHETQRNAHLASLKARIEKLKLVDVKKAQYALGRKAYGLRIAAERFGGEYEEIAAIESSIVEKRAGVPANHSASNIQLAKNLAMSVKMKAEAEGLELRLKQMFVALGGNVEAVDEAAGLESEMAGVQSVHSRIEELEKEYSTLYGNRAAQRELKTVSFSIAKEAGAKSRMAWEVGQRRFTNWFPHKLALPVTLCLCALLLFGIGIFFEQIFASDNVRLLIPKQIIWGGINKRDPRIVFGGFIDDKGKIVIGPKWDDSEQFDDDGLAAVQLDGKWGFINKNGRIVISPQWKEAPFFCQGLAAVKRGKQWGFIDLSGRMVIAAQWDHAESFNVDFANVQSNGKWGLINKAGKLVIRTEWDKPLSLYGGWFFYGTPSATDPAPFPAEASRGDKTYFIDQHGRVLGGQGWDDAYGFRDGYAEVKLGGKWGIIDIAGNIVVTPQWDNRQDFSEGLAPLEHGGEWGYIDTNDNMIIEAVWDEVSSFSDGVAKVRRGDKWGFIDKGGRLVSEPVWDEVSSFLDGVAKVRRGDKWGFIDKGGRLVSAPQWDDATLCTNGLAQIQRDSKWGFIAKTGQVVVQPQWDEVYSFVGDFASVRSGTKWGLIDKTGKVIVNLHWDCIQSAWEGSTQYHFMAKSDSPGYAECIWVDSQFKEIWHAKVPAEGPAPRPQSQAQDDSATKPMDSTEPVEPETSDLEFTDPTREERLHQLYGIGVSKQEIDSAIPIDLIWRIGTPIYGDLENHVGFGVGDNNNTIFVGLAGPEEDVKYVQLLLMLTTNVAADDPCIKSVPAVVSVTAGAEAKDWVIEQLQAFCKMPVQQRHRRQFNNKIVDVFCSLTNDHAHPFCFFVEVTPTM